MHQNKGFTIIELAAIMVIILLLASTAIPIYNKFTANAYKKHICSDIKTVSDKLEEYLVVNDILPPDIIPVKADILQLFAIDGKLYDAEGNIKQIDESQKYYALPSAFIKSQTSSKLIGCFITSAKRNIYYIDIDTSFIP